MSKVSKLKAVIDSLSEKNFVQFRLWFAEKDWKKWDKEIEADSKSGKLNFFVREAFNRKIYFLNSFISLFNHAL